MRKALILGAGGYLGQRIPEVLMQTGQFDLKLFSRSSDLLKQEFPLLEIFNISDLTTDNYHVQSCDLIINCVGIDNNGCQKTKMTVLMQIRYSQNI